MPTAVLVNVGTAGFLGAAAPPFNILPAQVASAQAKAAANTTQWQAYKTTLDNSLTDSTLIAAYQGLGLFWAANYALGYRCLKNSDPTTAAKYAQKALGIVLAGINTTMLGVDTGKIFLGRGDGSTKTFPIPHSSYLPASLNIYVNRGPGISTNAITKGAHNGQDYNTIYGMPLKVSNTSDGAFDYAQGTDWRRNDSIYPGQSSPPDGGTGDERFGNGLIDWSLGSATQPTTGATYYVTYAYILDSYAHQALTTNYTVSGTTVTFVTAPLSTEAVWADYLFTDANGNQYQNSYNGMGGLNGVYRDAGFPSRGIGHLAVTADWIWDYPGFTSALKSTVLTAFYNMYSWLRDHAYFAQRPGGNYGAGHYFCRTMMALLAQGRDAANAASMAGEMATWRSSFLWPYLSAPDLTQKYAASMQDGWYGDGCNYQALAVTNLLLAELAVEEYGWGAATLARSVASVTVRTLLYGEPYNGGDGTANPSYMDPEGDGAPYPPPFATGAAQMEFTALAALADDPVAVSYANYVIQNYPFQDPVTAVWKAASAQVDDWRGLSMRDPAATTSSGYRTVPPYARLARGMNIVYARKDFTYGSTWLCFHCGNQPLSGHPPYNPGELQVWRGADILIARPTKIVNDQAVENNQSRYGTMVLVDDLGGGYMTYPSTSGGPAQGFDYGGPSHLLTLPNYEEGSAYIYLVGDYTQAYYSAGFNKNPVTELVRSILYLPALDYVFLHDRITLSVSTFQHWLQWFGDPSATISQSGNTWTIALGGSKLFGASSSDVALTTANDVVTAEGSCKRIQTHPTTFNTAKVRYRTALQSAPTATASMDATADIPSTDTHTEGTKLGDVVAVFGRDGALGASVNASYAYTGTSGHTITHYVMDLVPAHTYTLGGVASGTRTASANGLVTFTTTANGSGQTVILTY